MDLVISYTSADRDKLRPVLDGLHRLRHTVWFDQELTGGQDWWDTILSRIRACDALLVALSPGMLESEACALEGDYARAVGKPILPVMIERVLPELLHPALAAVQIVDFTDAGKGAFGLVAALADLPPAKPLPDPLPDPPRVPVSYLGELSERVSAQELALDEQLSIVGKLRYSLTRPRERDAALEIIQRFRARNDLYLVPAKELDALIAENGPSTPDPREAWTTWANAEFPGKTALVAVAVEAALDRQRSGGSSDDAAQAARSAGAAAENRYRDVWSTWALKEFGADADLARVGTEAAVARLVAGASSEAAVAAAKSAVEAETQRRPRQVIPQFPGLPRMDGEATAALVLGIAGLFCGGLILNGLAIWFGRRSQRRIQASGGQLDGAGRAKAGFYLGIAGMILWGLILLVYIVAANSPPASPPA